MSDSASDCSASREMASARRLSVRGISVEVSGKYGSGCGAESKFMRGLAIIDRGLKSLIFVVAESPKREGSRMILDRVCSCHLRVALRCHYIANTNPTDVS